MRQQDIRYEFSELVERISKDVLKSTVNESIKKASVVIEDKIPEINILTKELKSTSDDLIKQSMELNKIKEELNKKTKGGMIIDEIKSLENTIIDLKDKVEKNLVKTDKNITTTQKELSEIRMDVSKVNQSRIEFQKTLEDTLFTMLSKQETEIKSMVKQKSTMIILLLAGIGMLLLVFN